MRATVIAIAVAIGLGLIAADFIQRSPEYSEAVSPPTWADAREPLVDFCRREPGQNVGVCRCYLREIERVYSIEELNFAAAIVRKEGDHDWSDVSRATLALGMSRAMRNGLKDRSDEVTEGVRKRCRRYLYDR
ncbi:MAG: hypothetical protein AAFR11_09825 [Pseudomonadota bacterium]